LHRRQRVPSPRNRRLASPLEQPQRVSLFGIF
jgi:hypothetical protein